VGIEEHLLGDAELHRYNHSVGLAAEVAMPEGILCSSKEEARCSRRKQACHHM
jgi:hypothetical protein